jgi:1-aminocyclopropane-1-carboxylate deaminase/D-cysteine desulfhydrase-like pyridoxal-dependent ACC family enzyme
VHGIGVCDDEDYFYKEIASIADEMGFQYPTTTTTSNDEPSPTTTEEYIRNIITIHQGKGLGYAISTPDELQFVQDFAYDTGIVLDPVYTGKALYNFIKYVQSNIHEFRNKKILFWHTGGTLGLYDKVLELHDNQIQNQSPCYRLDVYGKGFEGNSIDISQPTTPK